MNILVVDDETVQVQTLKRGLQGKGHLVLTATSARDAQAILEDQGEDVDVVITDYAMGGVSGMELLKTIRRLHARLPVILMTAYGEKKLVIEALRNQASGFIEKPFNLEDLLSEVERCRKDAWQTAAMGKLSRIIPNFVHQVNTPLMSIMASAYLAKNEPGDRDGVRKHMEAIIENIKCIKNINTKISQFSRFSSGVLASLDLVPLLEKCLTDLQGLLELQGVEWSLLNHAGSAFVLGNAFDLEQAIKNLVINAVESMEDSTEKRLETGVRKNPETGVVTLFVADRGAGVLPEVAGNIFERYFTSKKSGTGLGLHVVKAIMEKHRGVVRFESKPGTGTTFFLEFPGAREKPAA